MNDFDYFCEENAKIDYKEPKKLIATSNASLENSCTLQDLLF